MKKLFLTFVALVAFSFVILSCGLGASMAGEWTLESQNGTNGSNYTSPFVTGSSTNTYTFKAESDNYTMLVDSTSPYAEFTMSARGTFLIDGEKFTVQPADGTIWSAKCVIENDTMTWSEFDGYNETYSSWVWKKK